MDLEGSQTYTNINNVLIDLFITNSFLEIFETIAYDEVLIPISFLFNTSARNMKYIINALYLFLYGETTTLENLEFIRELEDGQLRKYREYSSIALEEGYDDISSWLNGVANIMLNHVVYFDDSITSIINDELFCQEKETFWICLACGNILTNLCAPEFCPVCGLPRGYYQQLTTY